MDYWLTFCGLCCCHISGCGYKDRKFSCQLKSRKIQTTVIHNQDLKNLDVVAALGFLKRENNLPRDFFTSFLKQYVIENILAEREGVVSQVCMHFVFTYHQRVLQSFPHCSAHRCHSRLHWCQTSEQHSLRHYPDCFQKNENR